MSQTVQGQDIQDILTGACILASGGGGSYQASLKIAAQGIGNATITIAGTDEVGVDAWLSCGVNMGSPDALFKQTNPHAGTNAMTALATQCSLLATQSNSPFGGFTDFGYVIPIEVGAINVATPLAIAAQLNIPVIDADGAGRSIPLLPLTVWAGTVPIYPNAMASESPLNTPFNSATINVSNEWDGEDVIGAIMESPPFGGIGGLAIYAQTGSNLGTIVPVIGSVSDSLSFGQAWRTNPDRLQAALAMINYMVGKPANARQASIIFTGEIVDMEQTAGLTDIGRIVIEAQDGTGTQLVIYNQNENIFAIRRDQNTPLIMGPDSMCYVPATGDTVWDNSDLWAAWQSGQRGFRVYVIGIAAPQVVTANTTLMNAWQTTRAQFGYPGVFAQPWL